MTYCDIFCDDKELSIKVRINIHDELKRLVRGTGWRVSVHFFSTNWFQVFFYNTKDGIRHWIHCKDGNWQAKRDECIVFLNALNRRTYPEFSPRINERIQSGKVKVYNSYEQFKNRKHGNT